MVGLFLMSHVHPPLKKVDQHLAPLKDQGTGKVPLGWAVKKDFLSQILTEIK